MPLNALALEREPLCYFWHTVHFARQTFNDNGSCLIHCHRHARPPCTYRVYAYIPLIRTATATSHPSKPNAGQARDPLQPTVALLLRRHTQA